MKEFINKHQDKQNFKADLATIIRIIEDTADLQHRPQTKFRPIEGHSLN